MKLAAFVSVVLDYLFFVCLLYSYSSSKLKFVGITNRTPKSQPNNISHTTFSTLRQRSLRPSLKRQISNRITRIAHIDRLPSLIIIRHLLHINHDLIIRRAAEIQPNLIHGRVNVVHAGIVRRFRRAAVILGQPETHDAFGARVCPVPLADWGGGVGDGGADVKGDGDAVVPGDVEAGAVVEEEGAVGGGGGDNVDGAVAGVVGGGGVLDAGTAWVQGVCNGGEEKKDEESNERGSIPHFAIFGCIDLLGFPDW